MSRRTGPWEPSRRARAGSIAALMVLCATSVAAPLAPDLLELGSLLQVPVMLPVDGSSGEPLSLPESQRAARLWSPEVEAAQRRAESFGYARDAARGALLPQVDLRFSSGRGRLESVDPQLTLDRRDSSLVLRQAIFNEPARREWQHQAALLRSAERQYDGAVSQALLDGGLAYLTALQARVVIELSAAYQALLDELLRYQTERAAGGGASAADRERVRARVANVRSSLADARSNLIAALRNLERLTDRKSGALRLDGAALLPALMDLDAAIAKGRASNAELLAARAEAEAAGADRDVQQSKHLPRLELEVTHARSTNAGGTLAYTRDSKAMLLLTVPLLHGGSDLAQVRAANARREELDARWRAADRKLTLEIETAYANLDAAAARFASVRDELDANRKVVDAFNAQLKGSNRPLLDVLDAYQRLYQSRVDLSQILITNLQNQLRIAHLTGTLTEAASSAAAPPVQQP